MALIGCQLNVTKKEALPLSPSSPPPPTLPKYAHPPQPLHAGTDFWTPVPPEWSDDSQHLLTKVSYLLHLGHPIRAHFNVQATFRLIELLSQLADLNAHPSQTLDRVLLVNTVVLPRLLYRCECFPLTEQHLLSLARPLERYVLGVAGLPSLIAHKTLYTHHTHGLRLRCLRVLQPTRVLDSLHINATLRQLRTTTTFHLCPFRIFQAALQLLGPHHSSSMLPLTTTWSACRQIRKGYRNCLGGWTAGLSPPQPLHPPSLRIHRWQQNRPPASIWRSCRPARRSHRGLPCARRPQFLQSGSHWSATGLFPLTPTHYPTGRLYRRHTVHHKDRTTIQTLSLGLAREGLPFAEKPRP